ncbi:MAG TPA: RagB/SusD family nutrient uptake outer membrane protein [Puia sp.]|nr:RagB/SusD family nutrient uptake outer membrane protein [Puia sp.]
MKRISVLATIMMFSIILDSCKKFLEKPSATKYDSETIFESVGRAEEVVVGCYQQTFNREEYYQLGMGTDECMSTESQTNSKNEIGNYVVDPSISPTSTYTAMYASIEYCNVAIAGIRGMTVNATDRPKANMLLGEAYAIRAMDYLNLVRFFGDVPYSNESVAQTGEFSAPRTSRDVIYDSCVADLQTAVGLLPWKSAGLVITPERFTKQAALGVLARVCLYAAGYSLRWDLKTYSASSVAIAQRPDVNRIKALYQIAADACKQVIDKGENSLLPSYETVWRDVDQGIYDNETMLEYGQWGSNDNGSAVGYTNGIYMHPSSLFGKSQPAMAAVPTYYFDFAQGDTRRDVTICNYGVNSDNGHDMNTYSSNTVGKYRANWGASAGTAVNKRDVDWVELRYSDILLMYAEALNELNNGPTADAINAIDQVRTRAFGGDATKIGTTPADYQGFRSAIINERKFEFGFEALRRTDLERWGILYETLTQTKQNLIDMANGVGAYANIDRYRVYKRTIAKSFPDPLTAIPFTGYTTLSPADSTALVQAGNVVVNMYGASKLNSQGALTANSALVTSLYRGLEKNKVEILPLAQTIIDVNPALKGEQQPKY